MLNDTQVNMNMEKHFLSTKAILELYWKQKTKLENTILAVLNALNYFVKTLTYLHIQQSCWAWHQSYGYLRETEKAHCFSESSWLIIHQAQWAEGDLEDKGTR